MEIIQLLCKLAPSYRLCLTREFEAFLKLCAPKRGQSQSAMFTVLQTSKTLPSGIPVARGLTTINCD